MPEYIDIEVALKTAIKERKVAISEQDMLNTQRVFKTIYSDLAEFLYSLPRADVVEVVRCKDCKHSDFIKSCSKYECRKGCEPLKYSNDFCSYGERKNDD